MSGRAVCQARWVRLLPSACETFGRPPAPAEDLEGASWLMEGHCRLIGWLVVSKLVEGGLAQPGATLTRVDSAMESVGIPSCADMPPGGEDEVCRIVEGDRQAKFASRPPRQGKLLISANFSKLGNAN